MCIYVCTEDRVYWNIDTFCTSFSSYFSCWNGSLHFSCVAEIFLRLRERRDVQKSVKPNKAGHALIGLIKHKNVHSESVQTDWRAALMQYWVEENVLTLKLNVQKQCCHSLNVTWFVFVSLKIYLKKKTNSSWSVCDQQQLFHVESPITGPKPTIKLINPEIKSCVFFSKVICDSHLIA